MPRSVGTNNSIEDAQRRTPEYETQYENLIAEQNTLTSAEESNFVITSDYPIMALIGFSKTCFVSYTGKISKGFLIKGFCLQI